MEIEEKNKLIADFMGFGEVGDKKILYAVVINGIAKGYYHPSMMLFSSSWDWLMYVVEKLISDFDGQQFYHAEEKLNDALLSVKIEKVFESCVNWILEINKDKQNEPNI